MDLPLEAYNVVREKVNDKDNQVMVRHGLACLHRLAGSFPHLKFIFWCIARRTLIPNRTSSVPWEGQYLQVVSRFRRHTLDVLKYCDRDTFTRRHMKDLFFWMACSNAIPGFRTRVLCVFSRCMERCRAVAMGGCWSVQRRTTGAVEGVVEIPPKKGSGEEYRAGRGRDRIG